ncbi:hypothetical protein [Aestuariicoccus sp. MJ-SS9]|uniref:hypothetical protein n=1 Tax=Aestuariicoccus sp. MJ-SS9 TaxID=3079855 RepID=UPI0029114A6A|nr:hypothetical protein [Aestuariicoccus sp. MJ-SS9]MDU8911812.1 hypothetical protein [Aestuariicoccus sp. MJ-SS9]
MRLSRMGAMFPTRLSFLRVLTRRLHDEGASLTRPVWNIDATGYGHAVYTIRLGGHDYSLVAVSTHLPDHMRTDRVIATAWDSSYVLYDGVPDANEVARIAANAPRQEAGRFTERDLVLSRANKSVRLFNHVVERLRAGQQPDAGLIRDVGYLMRTTAVYGNGKFGIADRALIADRPGLSGPFAAEMLTVWMIRSFTHDLVEHLGGAALDRGLKRHLGIGNSTGLGMAPFLVSHPVLLSNWMAARETALARVRALETLDDSTKSRLRQLAARAAQHLTEWNVPDPAHQARIEALRKDWVTMLAHISGDGLHGQRPLDALMRVSETLSEDAQELTVALLLEPFGELIDGLADCMDDPFGLCPTPVADTGTLRALIERHYDWALALDFDDPGQTRQFWYVSEEKLEPRLGDRYAEPGADRESPLDIARRVQALHRDLPAQSQPLPEFRRSHPDHDLALRRVLAADTHPYAEIRDNLIGAGCLPVDMLRCKLAFFGAAKFDPKSDRWTRITLAQGAPLPDELSLPSADDWWLPIFDA